jgi:hypothetical protein
MGIKINMANLLPFSGSHEWWVPGIVSFFSFCLIFRKVGAKMAIYFGSIFYQADVIDLVKMGISTGTIGAGV